MRVPRVFFSTTAQIALAFLITQIVAVGMALVLMHGFTQRTILSDAKHFVRELDADVGDEFRRGGARAATIAIEERLRQSGPRDAVIALRAPDGSIAVGNLDRWPAGLGGEVQWRETRLSVTGSGGPAAIGLHTSRLSGGYQLLTGQTLEGESRLREISRNAFVISSIVGIVFAALGTWLFAAFIGRRVNHIAVVASHFGDGRFAARVTPDGSGDAFDRLGNAINAMLERVEALVTELRLVTDALAHDLRSPVARLKATIENALEATRDTAALAALAKVAREADGLLKMLTAALQISRAEAGIGRDQFTRFDAAQMLRDLGEVYGPLAEDHGFSIAVAAPAHVKILAHRDLIGQSVANLIDNALKYAASGRNAVPGPAIVLAIAENHDRIEISVADNGSGISADQREAALRRFGRLDAARSAGGAGLGLSLVNTVAHLHAGLFELCDNNPGLRAVLTLPVTATDDDGAVRHRRMANGTAG